MDLKLFSRFCPACDESEDVRAASREDVMPACTHCHNTDQLVIKGPLWEPSSGEPYRLEDLQPLRDRILVAPLAVASRSKGGIHLVDNSQERERPQLGIVLLVGPGAFSAGVRMPMTVKRGDCVSFGKYSGQEFTIHDRRVLNMAEAEVFTRLPAGCFQVKEHDNPKDNHLVGDWCDLCATPAELEAKAALVEERARLVAEQLAKAASADVQRLAERSLEEMEGGKMEGGKASASELRMLEAALGSVAGGGKTNTAESAARSALDDERERLRQARAAKDAAGA